MPYRFGHRHRRAAGRFAGIVALVLLGCLPASAHAILVKSAPVSGGVVDGGTVEIDMRYNSRIDRARSRLTLLRADRSAEVLKLSEAGDADELSAKATLMPGAYILRWQVLAIDGHITRGDVPFTVRTRREN